MKDDYAYNIAMKACHELLNGNLALMDEVQRLRVSLKAIESMKVKPPQWRQGLVKAKEIAREALK